MKSIENIKKAAIGLLVVAAFGPAISAAGPGKPGPDTIVKIAQDINEDSGEFSYLLGAVGCLTADDGTNPVAALLSGAKKHTLFAPTDEAFMNLQRALGVSEQDLAPEVTCTLGDATVFNVLAYHVTDGRRFSNSVFNKNSMKMIQMLNRDYIISNPNLTIDSVGATAVGVVADADEKLLANISASNGVIHVINAVLLPFTLTE